MLEIRLLALLLVLHPIVFGYGLQLGNGSATTDNQHLISRESEKVEFDGSRSKHPPESQSAPRIESFPVSGLTRAVNTSRRCMIDNCNYPELRSVSAIKGQIRQLTSSTGRLLEIHAANEVIDDNLIFNDRFMEGLTSLVRERTLPRVVHAKGGGAYGYFVVTHDVSDIISVNMFNGIGKKTPLTARFSSTKTDFGGADTVRDARGFAIKFNTPEGIFDLISTSVAAFVLKDPIKFPSFAHVIKRNPQTHRPDENMLWDYITQNPESVNFFIRVFSDQGIPSSYTKMTGFPIHTFAFCNTKGETFFGRFSVRPDSGVEGMSSEDATILAGENPDYLNQDLFDRIASGKNSSWTLYIQALTQEDVKNATINVFDTTLALDDSIYIPRPIGKIYLNRNPNNFIKDIEPLAFGARNLVPGIQGVDKVFEARSFVYLDAQNHRLGSNHNKIPANLPTAKTSTYYREGAQPLNSDDSNLPNYYPNSFDGPVPTAKPKCPKLTIKVHVEPNATNHEQVSAFFNNLDEDEQERVVQNFVSSLGRVTAGFLQERAIKLLTKINTDLGSRVQSAMNV